MSDQKPTPEIDPVVYSSLSKPLAISAFLLVACTAWALYDDAFATRPWKRYQKDFAQLYSSYLKTLAPSTNEEDKAVRESSEYKELEQQRADLVKEVEPKAKELEKQIAFITAQSADLNTPYQEKRAEIGALTYLIEVTAGESGKQSLRSQIEEVKKREVSAKITQADGSLVAQTYAFAKMEADMTAWRELKTKLVSDLAKLREPIAAVDKKMSDLVNNTGPEYSRQTLSQLQAKLDTWDVSIRQIHVKDIDLVDRCESCHLGAREPINITTAGMGGRAEFASHPDKELLKLHDPDKFGCSPCHNGNGVATSSPTKGHGRHQFWLYPMFQKENVQAGCQQCHVKEIVTEKATVLNEGREIFRRRGCIGCHRYEGFDPDWDELGSATQQIRTMEQQKAELRREITMTKRKGDKATDNDEAKKLYAAADNINIHISSLDAKIEQLDIRSGELLKEVKKVGPNLKEIKMKDVKEWVPVWIKDPHAWRENAKMPSYRLTDAEIQAISAYLWQTAVTGTLEKHPAGSAEKGKESFETRGCMGCHSIGEGSQKQGGSFAANLSRVGEKMNYDYMVRWILNPKQRTSPYDPYEKRDLTAKDYSDKGQPFVFDFDHSKSPINGKEILVQNMTPMPDMRVTVAEARDIASFLMTQKREKYSFPPAAYMDDPKLKDRGLFLIRNYGCAGCHEIKGLEEEQRIGTELTKEGSKPIERLDFGLLGHEAEHEGWYNHKGFFEHKLENPAIYDKGKEKASQLDRLKMPNFNLTKEEISAVTTFLLGSVESSLPDRYKNMPIGRKQDIMEGWWVVRKYNCMGCHPMMVNQLTSFANIKRYDDPDWKEKRPPSLIGEGARVNPFWLEKFLTNPALSEKDTDRNGIRTYLTVRMPTFAFSNGELRKLVRFFEALSSQAQPYTPSKLEPMTETERGLARALFTSEGAPCLKCHATGDAAHDKVATAPNLVHVPERLKPGWTRRWLLDPAMIVPGTAMPSGLFKADGARQVFAGQVPAGFSSYTKDHADLMVRYLFSLTQDELRRGR